MTHYPWIGRPIRPSSSASGACVCVPDDLDAEASHDALSEHGGLSGEEQHGNPYKRQVGTGKRSDKNTAKP